MNLSVATKFHDAISSQKKRKMYTCRDKGFFSIHSVQMVRIICNMTPMMMMMMMTAIAELLNFSFSWRFPIVS